MNATKFTSLQSGHSSNGKLVIGSIGNGAHLLGEEVRQAGAMPSSGSMEEPVIVRRAPIRNELS
jgi:hypothetical protein